MQLTISPSNVSWLSCQKRFHELATLRKYRQEKGKSPVLKFATMLHECMYRLYDPTLPGVLPHTGRMDAILNAALMNAAYRDPADREFACAKARKLLRAYMDQQDDFEADATVFVEKGGFFHVRVQGEVLYSLFARIDRVMAFTDIGLAVALDYKTGQTPPTPEQCLINTAVLKGLLPGFERYEFWTETIHDDGADRLIYRGAEMRGIIHLVTARVQRYLQATDYPAEPCDGCRFCPLRDDCQGNHNTVDVDDLDF